LPIKAHIETGLVLTYAVPAGVLEEFLSPGLELDTYGGFGFLAIGVMQTRDLRPACLPAWLGIDFSLAGYRIFARYRTRTGRTLRGLRILRSDTDRWPMALFGNLLTRYGYARSRWTVRRNERSYDIEIATRDGRADLHVEADLADMNPTLPCGSPFSDFRQARRFAGPLPFTFDYEAETQSIIRVEGVRQSWNPRPVPVMVHRNSFLQEPPFRTAGAVLANAFFVEDVPYTWRAGVREPLV